MIRTVENIERLSHARATLDAYGVEPEEQAVFDPSFVQGEPRLPLPYVDGDKYLTGAGLVVSESGGTTLVLETPPGYIDHLQEIGVLPEDTRVIQRPITKTKPGIEGYPAATPLALLGHEGFRFDTEGASPFFVSIFESDPIRKDAEAVGLRLLGRPDSTETNNKAKLQTYAKEYGIHMPPGEILRTWDDYALFVKDHEGETHWHKASTESGGDGVDKVIVSWDTIYASNSKMRDNAVKAFAQGEFQMSIEEYWPEDSAAPIDFPNVIERDAGELGEVIVNGSNCFVTRADGDIDYYGTFQQITQDGEFMGSKFYDPDPQIMEMILDQTQRLGTYNREVNGYVGIQGADFFVIRMPDGNIQVMPFELNSRPPISSYPEFLMRNLRTQLDGYESANATWDNINLVSNEPIVKGTKIPDLLGKDLAFGVRDRAGNVLRQVIPLATRALVVKNGQEEPEVLPSDRAKWFIYGANEEEKKLAKQELAARGIVFKL